jgi:hypothetical protein
MRFYNQRHRFYCGIDPHARKMYICIIDAQGKTKLHQNFDTDPALLFDAIFPYLEEVVMGVECRLPGTGLPIFAASTKSHSLWASPYT